MTFHPLPTEPTREMIEAGVRVMLVHCPTFTSGAPAEIYKAMLAASPPAEWHEIEYLYHRVMTLLRDSEMEHGLCQPRERRVCTACNAKDDLRKMLDAYKGAPVRLAAPLTAASGRDE